MDDIEKARFDQKRPYDIDKFNERIGEYLFHTLAKTLFAAEAFAAFDLAQVSPDRVGELQDVAALLNERRFVSALGRDALTQKVFTHRGEKKKLADGVKEANRGRTLDELKKFIAVELDFAETAGVMLNHAILENIKATRVEGIDYRIGDTPVAQKILPAIVAPGSSPEPQDAGLLIAALGFWHAARDNGMMIEDKSSKEMLALGDFLRERFDSAPVHEHSSWCPAPKTQSPDDCLCNVRFQASAQALLKGRHTRKQGGAR